MYYIIVKYGNYYYLNIIYQSEHVCRKENVHVMQCFMHNKVFEFEFEFEFRESLGRSVITREISSKGHFINLLFLIFFLHYTASNLTFVFFRLTAHLNLINDIIKHISNEKSLYFG